MANKAEFNVSFDLYNEDAVRKLQEEDPDLLPDYAVNSAKDLAYNKQQVNSAIESAILNGKSIDKIAEDLQDRMENVNERSAIKTARTAVTSAQNNGTLDSFYEARDMGINIQKEWEATLDDRTRPSHRELDEERRELDERFSNGLMYPGDPDGNPDEIYWCRCTLVSYMPDVEIKDEDKRITYKEWEEYKQSEIRGAGSSEESDEIFDKRLGEKNEEVTAKEVAVERVDNFISREAGTTKVAYKQVYRYTEQPSEEQIIAKLTNIDRGGSCQSVALAYCGQKAGYDVTDYRGGESKTYFEKVSTYEKITYLDGIKSEKQYTYTPLETVKEMLKTNTKKGKEYVLSAGKHTAIVKRTNTKTYKYLELQHGINGSGWKSLTEKSMKERFGIPKSSRWGQEILLLDVESFADCKAVPDILGYINTK